MLSIRIGSQTITDPVVIPKGTSKTAGFSETVSLSPGNYSLSLWYDAGNNGGTPSVKLGNDIPVEVKAEPAAPGLELASTPSFLNGSSAVPQNAPGLSVQIKNTGGIYRGNVSVNIFNSGENYPFSSFGSAFVSIDKGETKSLQYNDFLDLTPGQEYDALVFINGISEYLYPRFSFTVAEHRLSSDATLSSLTLSSGTLSPAFNASTTSYTLNVANTVSLIDVSGTANHDGATVSGNVRGKALEVGDNIVNITVTAEDGTTTMTYTVTIHRLSSDATLKSLALSSGTLSPSFNANTLRYTVNLSNDVSLIDVTGSANHPAATVNGNVSGKALDVGNNTVEITVTAEDGTSVSTYTVTLVRAPSSDVTLSKITVSDGILSPAFDANITDYTVNVANRVSLINVTGTANHPAATVSGNVIDMPLDVGDNVVNITVIAEDGSTFNIYTVRLIRDPEADTNLIAIAVNGSEISVGSTMEYSASCGETSFVLDLQTSPDAVVIVNGIAYADGQTVDLADDDPAAVNIWIATETGGAEKRYTLNITAPLNDSRLYYQRWDDVLAINHNPATNGGYVVSEVRWYRRQDDAPAGNKGYIEIEPGTKADYYAEIRTDEKLRKVCPVSDAKATDKVIAYPNPVLRGETLQLQLPETFAGGTLNIYDIKGSLKKSGQPLPSTLNSVSVSDLDSGIYLLHVFSRDGKRHEMKLIIE
jgi:hypothetical protein